MGWHSLISSVCNRLWWRSTGSQHRPRGARPLSSVTAEIGRAAHTSVRKPTRYRAEQLRALVQSLETRTLYSITQIGDSPSQFTNSNTLFNYTVPAGTDRLLVVTAADPNAIDVTGVTFGGVAMTQAIDRTDGTASNSIWYLHLGTGGAVSGDIVMSSGGNQNRFLAVITLAGVSASNPVSGATSGVFGLSLSVASENGDVVFGAIDAFHYNPQNLSAGIGQTSIHTQSGAGTYNGFDSYNTSLKAGAASTTLSWSGIFDSTILVGININAAPNLAPTAVAIQNPISIAENANTSSATKVGDIVVTDDSYGTNTLSLSGADAANFEIVGAELQLKAGVALNYEVKSSYAVTVNVDDTSVGATPDATYDFTLSVTDVNETPTAITVSNPSLSVAEDVSTATAIKLLDFSITDDALGTNAMSLSGADAAYFEVNGSSVYLKAGVSLDYETKSTLALVMNVDDTTVGSTPDVTRTLTVSITDANDLPTVTTIANQVIAPNTATTALSFEVSDADAYANLLVNTSGLFAQPLAVGTASFGAQAFNMTGDLVLADPILASGPLTNAAQVAGKIAVIDRGTLSFSAKVKYAQDAGAIGVIIVNNSSSSTPPGMASSAGVNPQPTIPVLSITQANGNTLKTAMANGTVNVSMHRGLDLDFLTIAASSSNTGLVPDNQIVVSGSGANRTVTVTPVANATGTATITLTVNDGGLTTTKTFDVTVNTLPVAQASVVTTNEDTTKSFAVSDFSFTDAESNALASVTVSNLALATGDSLTVDLGAGRVNVTDGMTITAAQISSLQYTPAANANGNDRSRFDFTVNDALAGSVAATMKLHVTAVNDAPVKFAQTFRIPENSLNGAWIGAMTGTDLEDGTSLTYGIVSGNSQQVFSIEHGNLYINRSQFLNFESTTEFTLMVAAIDTSAATSTPAQVKVELIDVNEAPAVTPTQFLIGENSVNNAFIGNILSSDVDAGQTRTYSIISGNTSDAFKIDATTGVLRVNNSAVLDFESVQRFDLTIRVIDNGTPALSGNATVNVFLRNENDAPVVVATDFLIGENSNSGALIGMIPVTDQDSNQTRTFSIVAGNTDNAFSIDTNTGALRVNNSAALNYEAVQRFDLVIRVVDNGNPAQAGSARVRVFLRDVNETPSLTPTEFLIAENSLRNAFIGQLPVKDVDAGQTHQYSIVSGNNGDAFSIDANTGILRVNNPQSLDFEAIQRFDLTVRVVDSGTPAIASTAIVKVHLRNENEAPQVLPTQFLISENAPNGAFIGNVPGFDPDAGQTRTYSIVAGNKADAFAIDPNTGVLRVNNSRSVNFEEWNRFDLIVRAVDNGNPALAGVGPVTVFLRDVNEAPIVLPQDFLISENSANDAFIGIVKGMDPDLAATPTYSIVGGNTDNAFRIDPTLGTLRVNNSAALDFEINPQFNLTVRLTDTNDPTLFSTAQVRVYLRDLVGARTGRRMQDDLESTTVIVPSSKANLTTTESLFNVKKSSLLPKWKLRNDGA